MSEQWHVGTDGEFEERLASLDQLELNRLSAQMGVARARIQAEFNAAPNYGAQKHAQRAADKLAVRHKMVRAALAELHAEGTKRHLEKKRAVVAEMRALLERGDVQGCLRTLVDYFDPDAEAPDGKDGGQ